MPNSIQSQEYSKDGGTDGALYITDSDGNPNLLGLNRNDKGRWLNAYNGNSSNRWNRENGFVFLVPQFTSFLRPWAGVFLYLTAPAAEPSADF